MNDLTPKQKFDKYGAILIKDVLPKELCHYLTTVLMRSAHAKNISNKPTDDSQIPGAASVMGHHIVFDTVAEMCWPYIEGILEEKLIPTYTYARLYQNKNELKKHKDRPSCEISFTLQLGRSHHYSWPIFVEGMRYDLAEGDAVLYKGCEVEHWRDPCDGPDEYYSGQVFCHYVRENGPYKEFAFDKRWPSDNGPYERFRTHLMKSK